LNHEEFIRRAIVSLRKEGYKGIHSVYSGFNSAFKKYFNGENPVEVTNRLAQEGKIVVRPPHSRSKCNKSRSDLKRCFVGQAFPGPVVNQ